MQEQAEGAVNAERPLQDIGVIDDAAILAPFISIRCIGDGLIALSHLSVLSSTLRV